MRTLATLITVLLIFPCVWADNSNEPLIDLDLYGFGDDAIYGVNSEIIASAGGTGVVLQPREEVGDDDHQLMWAQEHTDTRHEVVDNVTYRYATMPLTTARQTITPHSAGDDGVISHRDVTSLGEIPARQAWAMRGDADGVIHRTAVPLGTCDNLIDCAAHAQDTCEDLGYGDATSATLGDNDSCNYTCANGIAGHVTCL